MRRRLQIAAILGSLLAYVGFKTAEYVVINYGPQILDRITAIRSPGDVAVLAQLHAAEFYVNEGNFEAAYFTLKETVDGDLYDELSAPTRFRIDYAFGVAAGQMGQPKEAHQAYVRATSYSGAGRELFYARMQYARLANDFADAYLAFRLLREGRPSQVLGLNDGSVHALEQGFGTLPDDGEAQFAFEEYLEAVEWEPESAAFSRDVIWFHYAQNLLTRGETERAAEIARRIRTPDVLPVLHADRRFDDLVRTDDAAQAVDAAALEILAQTEDLTASDLRWVESHSALANRLMQLGRWDEALFQINRALSEAAQLSVLRRQEYDFDANFDFVLVVKSHLLFGLGRTEEALGLASVVGAGGRMRRPNTTMSLLQARFLIALGRSDDALVIVEPMGDTNLSLEGLAELAFIRACAAFQTGNADLYDENIRYLREAKLGRPVALIDAFLCADNLDSAAEAAIIALKDPRQRALVLENLQRFAAPPARTAWQDLMEERREYLRLRDDVAAAVLPVGRINTYRIVNTHPLY